MPEANLLLVMPTRYIRNIHVASLASGKDDMNLLAARLLNTAAAATTDLLYDKIYNLLIPVDFFFLVFSFLYKIPF